ncbi:RE1 [Symbiodinium sp. CCMP2592]|nr:RE1 [Symbiodinium sp. CCMP2592]
MGIVMNAVTDPGLKDHLIRNAVRLKTYVALKEELLEVARTSRVLNSQPVPMDIGAVPGKGKPKGKGNQGKDKGKKRGGGKPSTPAPKANPNKNKECHYCHKLGHDEADGKAKKGDKGKSKGRKNRPHADDPGSYVAALTAGQGSEVLVGTGVEDAEGQSADGTARVEDAGSPAEGSAGGPAMEAGAGGPAEAPSSPMELPKIGEPTGEVSEATRKRPAKKIPDTVSVQEFQEHALTHFPYRHWCESCVAGKSREDLHHLRTPKERKGEVPRVCLDYCFLGRALKGEVPKEAKTLETPMDEADGLLPVLVMVDQETGCTFSAVTAKGVNAYAVHVVVEMLKFLGRQRVILMTDGEPAIRSLAEAAAKQIGTGAQLQHAPKETHGQSNGAAERAILETARQVRTLAHAVEAKYPGLHITNETELYPWLVRHSGWLITRYLVKADGRTPYERLRGREYKGEIVEPLETVQYKIDKEVPLGVAKGRKQEMGTAAIHRTAPELLGTAAKTPVTRPSQSSSSAGNQATKRGSDGSKGPSAKIAKEQRKGGEKRAAELSLEEALAQDVTLEDEVPLVAGYPETGTVTQAFDERTGEELPLEKVKHARGRELDKMLEHSVKKDISWEEARRRKLKIVKSRWVDGWKVLPDDPEGVRSRCVAQEINNYQREDVSSGTPPLKAHRMVLAHAATRRAEEAEHTKLIGRYDVSRAFFHAEATGKIAVVPARDVDEGHLWYLLKAMNGTREASKQWSIKIAKTKKRHGFLEVASVPGLYYHPIQDLPVSCHGDDFLLPRIGPAHCGGQCTQGDHLHRRISWGPKGYTWEADEKHVEVLVSGLGLKGAKGVDAPASKDCGKSDREAEKELDAEEAALFRKMAGTALYLSLDRPTIQFAVSDITSGMARPLRLHMHRLRRLGRYLINHPREVWKFEYQEAPKELVVYTDSDWASDTRNRKSMSCYVEMFGKHMIESSCARQAAVALSSGEAEFYALTRGVVAGVMSQQIWEIINFNLPVVARTDSTAGRGIAQRKGCGKVKHLSIRELWLQDFVQEGRVKIVKEPRKTNIADVGTKALPGPRVSELVKMMPLRRGLTAAIPASCLFCTEAQPTEPGNFEPTTFWTYVVLLHVLAAVGLFKLCRDCMSLFTRPGRTSPESADAEVQATLAPVTSLNAGNTAQHLVNIQIGTVNDVGGRPGRTEEAVGAPTPAPQVAASPAPRAEGPGGATSHQTGARHRINRPTPDRRVFVTSQGPRNSLPQELLW